MSTRGLCVLAEGPFETKLGGGDVSWATTNPEPARFFAAPNPAGGAPGAVGVSLRRGALEKMQAMGAVQVESDGVVKLAN